MDVGTVYSFHADGDAQRLVSCAKALETVAAFYAAHPNEHSVIQTAALAYITTDTPEREKTYFFIPAYVFEVWEYDTRDVNGETLQYATLNRFVVDAKTGELLSENRNPTEQ